MKKYEHMNILKKHIAKIILSPHYEYVQDLLKIYPLHLLKTLQEKEFSTV